MHYSLKSSEGRNTSLLPTQVSEYLLSTFCVLSRMPGVMEESIEELSLGGWTGHPPGDWGALELHEKA